MCASWLPSLALAAPYVSNSSLYVLLWNDVRFRATFTLRRASTDTAHHSSNQRLQLHIIGTVFAPGQVFDTLREISWPPFNNTTHRTRYPGYIPKMIGLKRCLWRLSSVFQEIKIYEHVARFVQNMSLQLDSLNYSWSRRSLMPEVLAIFSIR